MAPLESEQLDEKGQMDISSSLKYQLPDEKGQMEFQEGSPDYSLSTLTSNSQTTIDSNFRDVLKSIERVLSVGALDELLLSEPEKILKAAASPSSNSVNASVFQISQAQRLSEL